MAWRGLAAAAWLAAGTVQAQAVAPPTRNSLALVFGDAAPEMKLVVALLLLGALAAAVLWVLALVRGEGGRRTLAFLSTLRVAGPLLGVVGGAYVMVNGLIALAWYKPEAPLLVMAPGLAEAVLSVMAGALAGLVAVLAHGHLGARAAPLPAAV